MTREEIKRHLNKFNARRTDAMLALEDPARKALIAMKKAELDQFAQVADQLARALSNIDALREEGLAFIDANLIGILEMWFEHLDEIKPKKENQHEAR